MEWQRERESQISTEFVKIWNSRGQKLVTYICIPTSLNLMNNLIAPSPLPVIQMDNMKYKRHTQCITGVYSKIAINLVISEHINNYDRVSQHLWRNAFTPNWKQLMVYSPRAVRRVQFNENYPIKTEIPQPLDLRIT